MKTIDKWIILVTALASLPCAANGQTLVTERSTFGQRCAGYGVRVLWKHAASTAEVVTITVLVPRRSHCRIVRDDGASPHSVEHSLRKAHTALTYDMPSSEYGKRAAKRVLAAPGSLHLANITTAAGGLRRDKVRNYVGRRHRYFGHARLARWRRGRRGMRASRHRPNRQRPDWQLTNYGGNKGPGPFKMVPAFLFGFAAQVPEEPLISRLTRASKSVRVCGPNQTRRRDMSNAFLTCQNRSCLASLVFLAFVIRRSPGADKTPNERTLEENRQDPFCGSGTVFSTTTTACTTTSRVWSELQTPRACTAPPR